MDPRFPGQPTPDEPVYDPKTGARRRADPRKRIDEPWDAGHDLPDTGHAHWTDATPNFDAAFSQAMHDLPLPAGLADRILDRLNAPASAQQAAGAQQGADAHAQHTAEPIIENLPEDPAQAATLPHAASPAADILPIQSGLPVESGRAAKRQRQPFRRHSLLAGLAATAAAAAAVFLLSGWLEPEPEVWGPERVMQAAHDFVPPEPVDDWALAAKAPPPQKFAPPRNVKTSGQIRWRQVRGTFLGRPGAAYEITSPSGARAVLYVLKLQASGAAPRFTGLPAVPPPPLATANRTTAAWAAGGRLYVMVVQGGPNDYRSFFRAQSLA
ncbi:MAG: hypothetical protein WD278_17905 [Pirellulales bacterium]